MNSNKSESQIDQHADAHSENTEVLVTSILTDAMRRKATDIYLEQSEGFLIVSYRLSGDVQPIMKIQDIIGNTVVAFLRTIAKLNHTSLDKGSIGMVWVDFPDRYLISLSETSGTSEQKLVLHFQPVTEAQIDAAKSSGSWFKTITDFDLIIQEIRKTLPDIEWSQWQVCHPGADDDGLWWLSTPSSKESVQIESWNRMCPFTMEGGENDELFTGNTVTEVAQEVIKRLTASGAGG